MFFTNRPAGTVFAARAAFTLAGFSIAAWAPLVPFIKQALNLSHIELSHLILLMGAGSITGMVLISFIIRKLGIHLTLAVSAATLVGSLLFLAGMPDLTFVSPAVFIFGLTLGCVEVGGNIYGTHLEKTTGRILLPSMHGCYSLGEVMSLGTIFVLLSFDSGIFMATAIPAGICALITLYALASVKGSEPFDDKADAPAEKLFVLPKGTVMFFALVASLIYMVEGGMLDWSALFMLQKTDIDIDFASSGYIVLMLATAAGRFCGASLIRRFSSYTVVWGGVTLCAAALITVYFVSNIAVIYACFVVLGFSLANIMPVCISLAGRQNNMPLMAAVSSVSTCGYGALIIGPAFIGLLSELLTLNGAFCVLGLMTLALSGFIMSKRRLFMVA